MNFKARLKKYSDEFAVMSFNSDPDKKYRPETIHNLLCARESFARFCGISILQPNDTQNVKLLYGMSNDNHAVVRYMVACKLSEINNRKAITVLTKALTDENRYVREAVLRSLREIADTRVIDNIYPLLSDKWHNVRLEASITLYSLDKDKPIEYILGLLKDKSKKNRLAGIEFLTEHAEHCTVQTIAPLQDVATNDRDREVRNKAEGLSRELFDRGILDIDTTWDRICLEDNADNLISLACVLSDINDNRIIEIFSRVLNYEFWLENQNIDKDYDEEIKGIAVHFFMDQYKQTGDITFIDEIIGALLHSYNCLLKETIAHILSMSVSDEILDRMSVLTDWPYIATNDLSDYNYFFQIIVSIGGDTAIDLLSEFFKEDDMPDIDIIEPENIEKMFTVLITSENIKAKQLLTYFLDEDYFEFLDYGLKKKCISAAERAKTRSAVANLSGIVLNRDENMIVRRKAAQALGLIGTRKALVALNEVLKDKHASNNLKKVAEEALITQ